MDFRVQLAGWDKAGRYFAPNAQDVQAPTALQVAEAVCGRGLSASGDYRMLAATVWPRDNPKRMFANFYRHPR